MRPSVDPKATAAEKGGLTVLSGLRMYLQRTTTVASNKVEIMSWLEISIVYHTIDCMKLLWGDPNLCFMFLAVQNSSIGDLVTDSLTH